MYITPIKNLVKIKDYHSYLLRQSVIWTNLKKQFIDQQLEGTRENTNRLRSITKRDFFSFTKEPSVSTFSETEEGKELTNKLAIVQQRLELLENEWNRTEYYMLYQFEMIEVPHELTSSFFSFTMQEMKTALTYH